MKFFKFISISVISLLLISCEKESNIPEAGELEGIWVEERYEEDLMILGKSDKMDEDNYGFKISEDGKFLEHKNSGSCGTPPISYADFAGTWKYESDSVLVIDVAYWGGTMIYKMDIVELTGNTLKVRYHYSN